MFQFLLPPPLVFYHVVLGLAPREGLPRLDVLPVPDPHTGRPAGEAPEAQLSVRRLSTLTLTNHLPQIFLLQFLLQ